MIISADYFNISDLNLTDILLHRKWGIETGDFILLQYKRYFKLSDFNVSGAICILFSFCVFSCSLCRFEFILYCLVGTHFSASLPCSILHGILHFRLDPHPPSPKIHKMYTFFDWNIRSSFQNMASLLVSFFFIR
jgi:hypothetical protein